MGSDGADTAAGSAPEVCLAAALAHPDIRAQVCGVGGGHTACPDDACRSHHMLELITCPGASCFHNDKKHSQVAQRVQQLTSRVQHGELGHVNPVLPSTDDETAGRHQHCMCHI